MGVLKSHRDLGILLNEKWYRMPIQGSPKLRFQYLATPWMVCGAAERTRYYFWFEGMR